MVIYLVYFKYLPINRIYWLSVTEMKIIIGYLLKYKSLELRLL